MDEEDKAFERYNQILEILNKCKSDKKQVYINLINELIKKCIEYIRNVNQIQHLIDHSQYRLTAEAYRDSYSELDLSRRLAHNALIDQLTIVNRNLFKDPELKNKIPIGGIYSLNPDSIKDRNFIAQWAAYLISSLAKKGIVSHP
jgi:hypothetical protein